MGRSTDTTNTHRVRNLLRREILSGEISLGSRLPAETIAERYKVSRTIAREAFMLLAREGLLEIIPRRGAVVRSFDADDVLSLYEIRLLLEPFAARRAATRIKPDVVDRLAELCEEQEAIPGYDDESIEAHIVANREFHSLIIDATESTRLVAALASVEGLPVAFRTQFWRDPEHRQQSLTCHRSLVSALRQGQGHHAETIMRMHIEGAVALLRPDAGVLA